MQKHISLQRGDNPHHPEGAEVTVGYERAAASSAAQILISKPDPVQLYATLCPVRVRFSPHRTACLPQEGRPSHTVLAATPRHLWAEKHPLSLSCSRNTCSDPTVFFLEYHFGNGSQEK